MSGGSIAAILSTTIIVALSLAFFALVLWLIARILHKAGYSRWWCLIWFVPFVNFVMLWVFAFAQWPRLRARHGDFR